MESMDLHIRTPVADERLASQVEDILRKGKAIVDTSSSKTSTTKT